MVESRNLKKTWRSKKAFGNYNRVKVENKQDTAFLGLIFFFFPLFRSLSLCHDSLICMHVMSYINDIIYVLYSSQSLIFLFYKVPIKTLWINVCKSWICVASSSYQSASHIPTAIINLLIQIFLIQIMEGGLTPESSPEEKNFDDLQIIGLKFKSP